MQQIFSLSCTGGIISALIKNTGTSPILSGTLRFYYRDVYGAEYEITGGQGIAIGSIPVNGQATRTFVWNIPDAAEVLIGRISAVSPVEYNDLNNENPDTGSGLSGFVGILSRCSDKQTVSAGPVVFLLAV
jgi:hypothetical protein